MSRRTPRLLIPLAASALLGASLSVLPATSAGAATFTVQNESQLRAAVAKANQANGEDTIRLARNIVLRRGALQIADSLVLDGRGKNLVARSKDRILDVAADITVRVEDVTLRGGRAPEGESGGAIRATMATLVVIDSRLVGNRALGEGASGGAIMNDGGELTVMDSRLERNRAERAGGGIEANAGVTTVTDSLLRRNRTGSGPGNGGGLHLTGPGGVVVEDSRILKNRASSEGGGLWNSADGQMTVTGTLLRGNVAKGAEATNGGGALFNDGGTLAVENTRMVGNRATGEAGSGGGVLNDQGLLSMNTTTLVRNRALRAGGAVETNLGTVDMADVDMTGNRTGDAPGNGGGLHLTGMAQVTYDGGTVTGNDAAAQGGGLWNSDTGFLMVMGVDVSGNTAPEGPDVYNDGGLFLQDGFPVPPNSFGVPGLPDLPLPLG